MKKRGGIFVFLCVLIVFAVFAIVKIAFASKYYYESYEPSEMYAVANDDNSGIRNSHTIRKQPTLTKKNDNEYQNETVLDDKVIRNTIILKMKKKQPEQQEIYEEEVEYENDDNKQDLSKAKKEKKQTFKVSNKENKKKVDDNEDEAVIQKQTKSRITKKTIKKQYEEEVEYTGFKHKRIEAYLSAGYRMILFPSLSVSHGKTDFSNNNNYNAPNLEMDKIFHGFDISIGSKFYFSSIGTGFFAGAEFFYSYFFQKAKYNWQTSLTYMWIDTNVADYESSNSNVKSKTEYFDSLMNINLNHMLGAGIKFGYSISRLSIYGKINLGATRFDALWKMTDSSSNQIWNGSNVIPEDGNPSHEAHSKASAYYNIRNLAKNGEGYSGWIFTYGFGAGIEIAITKNFFVKVEYNHFFLKDININFGTNVYSYANGTREGQVGYTDTNGDKTERIKTNFGTITASLGICF